MELSKQQVIDKVMSFNYAELALWIRSRLHGDDPFFPVYLGFEKNLGEFLIDTFHHIKEEKFRSDFLEILGDLTGELSKLSRKQLKESGEYISELLFVCGNIKQFENKDILMEMAVSGKLKKIKSDDESTDLHTELLTTLASYKMVGNHEFWLQQFLDNSDKYYANPAFYALMDNLDRLFDHIHLFAEKFKGEIELNLGIEVLMNEYGKKEIFKRFKDIEKKLSPEQKEAVNQALKEAGYDKVYHGEESAVKDYQFMPASLLLQFIRSPKPEYEVLLPLKVSTAEIFKFMGFDVQLDHKIAGQSIDIFARRRKSFSPGYEYWICACQTEKKVGEHAFYHFDLIAMEIKRELEKPGYACDVCQVMFVSEKGFIKKVLNIARGHRIILKAYNELLSDLKVFYSRQKPLIEELDKLFAFPP